MVGTSSWKQQFQEALKPFDTNLVEADDLIDSDIPKKPSRYS